MPLGVQKNRRTQTVPVEFSGKSMPLGVQKNCRTQTVPVEFLGKSMPLGGQKNCIATVFGAGKRVRSRFRIVHTAKGTASKMTAVPKRA